jgi:hypothetical protein
LIYNNYVDNLDPTPETPDKRPRFLHICSSDGLLVYGNIVKKGGMQTLQIDNSVGALIMNNYVEGQDNIGLIGGKNNAVVNNTVIGEYGCSLWLMYSYGTASLTHKGLFLQNSNIFNNVAITDEATNTAGPSRGPLFIEATGSSSATLENSNGALNFVDYNWYCSNDLADYHIAIFNQPSLDVIANGNPIVDLADLQAKWISHQTFDLTNDTHSYFQAISRNSNLIASQGIGKGMPMQINASGDVTIKGNVGAVSGGGSSRSVHGGNDFYGN